LEQYVVNREVTDISSDVSKVNLQLRKEFQPVFEESKQDDYAYVKSKNPSETKRFSCRMCKNA